MGVNFSRSKGSRIGQGESEGNRVEVGNGIPTGSMQIRFSSSPVARDFGSGVPVVSSTAQNRATPSRVYVDNIRNVVRAEF